MQAMDVNSLFARAEQAFVAGRLDAARTDLAQVQRLAGEHPAVLHLLALVEKKGGAFDLSQQAFQRALQLAPSDPQINTNYANLLGDMGDAEGALDHYGKALAVAPGFHDAQYNRAVLLQKLGRHEEALTALDRVAAAAPADAKVQSARGASLRELKRLNEAAAAYEAALRLEPHRLVALHGRARVAMERGEATAPDFYRRALELRPGDAELQLGFAEALEAEGDPTCVEVLGAAVAERPEWTQGHSALARMRWEAGEGEAFTRGFEAAVSANPQNGDLWFAWARALASADHFSEAADVSARARAAVGDDPRLLLAEAVAASEALQLDRADRLFRMTPADMPGRSGLEARHRLRRGEYEAAGRLLDLARRELPWDVGTWALSGLQWRLAGDPRAEWLLAQPGFVDVRRLPLDEAQLAAIADRLRSLHRTRAHPIGQSLRGGTQTRGRLFDRTEPEILMLKEALAAAVEGYWDRLPPEDPAHPLLRHRARRPRFEGAWSVRLTGGGFHVSHFHPEGALSSACYIVVPDPKAPMEGWLEVGGPPGGLDVPIEPLARIEPAPGRVALFPSFLFHGTRPFTQGERLTVAFDVVAA